MKPMVSIIVPVYNAEKYINRCVDSILNQEYTDFELLLVDDGSSDSSCEICDTYAAADARVRVIHKPNTGVSDSRNIAIRQAQGTYLQFLDSDDWITPDATKLFVRAATEHNCDLVIADFYRVVDDRVSHKGDIEDDGVLTREEFAEHMMENPADYYYGVLWNKLYRRDLVEKYHLEMDTSVSWCEDFLFNMEYILHANVFYALQAPIYYYVKTPGSLVASQGVSISNTIKMKLMVFEYYNNFYKNIYDEKDYEKKRLSLYRFFVEAAGDGAVLPSLLPGVTKLGDERANINSDAISNDGILGESYRDRKLLERYLETIALRNDMTLKDVTLLFYLSQTDGPHTRKDLADFTGLSKKNLSSTLQHLSNKDFIKVTEIRISRKKYAKNLEKNAALSAHDAQTSASSRKPSQRLLQIDLLPAAIDILPDLATIEMDFDAARFAGFTKEEIAEYHRLSDKMKENIQKTLLA